MTPHLRDNARKGYSMCSQIWDSRTVEAQSVYDSRTCYYCRLAWQRRHATPTEETAHYRCES